MILVLLVILINARRLTTITNIPARMYKLDLDTRHRQVKPGHFNSHVSADWNITAPNGGYVAAIVANAMLAESDFQHILSFAAYFHKATQTTEADIHVQEIGRSGRLQTLEAGLWQNGTRASTFLATMAQRESLVGRTHHATKPPPDLSAASTSPRRAPMPFYDCVQVAIPEDQTSWMTGTTTDETEFWGTMSFVDKRPVDQLGLLVLADATAPPSLRLVGPVGWVPTLDYTVQIRRQQTVPYVKFRAWTHFITEGLVETDIQLWSPDNDILAIGRQLAMLRET